MALVIDIDGEGLELFEGTEFWITKQIHDLTNLETRNADYTKQIDVPATSKNARLLSVDDLFDTADAQPVIAVDCNIIIDGVPIANGAQLFVDKVTDEGLSCNILFGNFVFFDNINGNIDTIDLTEFAFEYTLDGIFGTVVNQTATITQADPGQITFDAPHNLQVGDYLEMVGTPVAYNSTIAIVISPTVVQMTSVYLGAAPAAGVAWFNQRSGGIKATTDGVVYPLTDWFDLIQTARLSPGSQSRKCQDILMAGFFVFTHTLMRKIVEEAGFTLDRSEIPTTALYQETALSAANPLFILQESSSVFAQQRAQSIQVVSGAVAERGAFPTEVAAPDPAQVQWAGSPDYQYTWVDAPRVVTVQTELYGSTNFGGNRTGTIELMQNATPIDSITFIAPGGGFQTVLSAEVTANVNDIFYVQITAADARDNITLEVTFQFSTLAIGATGSTPNRQINTPQTFLPEMSRVDFFKGILAMNNIVIQTDSLTKTVKMEYFQGINDNPEQTIETNTLGGFVRSSFLRSYFRNSILQYDETGLIRTDTSVTLQLFDERLAVEGVIVQLPFEACDNSIIYARDFQTPVANIDQYEFDQESETGSSWAIDDTTVTTPEDLGLVVGQYVGISDAEFRRVVSVLSPTSTEIRGFWTNTQQAINATTVISLTANESRKKIARVIPSQAPYPVADGFITGIQNNTDPDRYAMTVNGGSEGVFDDPMLWTNLAAANYTELFAALQTPQILQLEVILSVAEFAEIDFLRPVYLGDPYNAQFYINKIDQYKAGQPVRIELVRISTT